MNRWMHKCKFEIVFVVSQMDGWIDTWMDSVSLRYRICGKSDGWMDKCKFEIQEGWMDGWISGKSDVGWMDVLISVSLRYSFCGKSDVWMDGRMDR